MLKSFPLYGHQSVSSEKITELWAKDESGYNTCDTDTVNLTKLIDDAGNSRIVWEKVKKSSYKTREHIKYFTQIKTDTKKIYIISENWEKRQKLNHQQDILGNSKME